MRECSRPCRFRSRRLRARICRRVGAVRVGLGRPVGIRRLLIGSAVGAICVGRDVRGHVVAGGRLARDARSVLCGCACDRLPVDTRLTVTGSGGVAADRLAEVRVSVRVVLVSVRVVWVVRVVGVSAASSGNPNGVTVFRATAIVRRAGPGKAPARQRQSPPRQPRQGRARPWRRR